MLVAFAITVPVERISAIHQANYSVYGVRKMWHAFRREGIDIGREHTARLMRLAGVSGKNKGRSQVTIRRSKTVDTRPDLLGWGRVHSFGSEQVVGG